ncbi:MAG: DJ-1/PfpI family protein [Acidimicrobiia bacterium]|nr:DJ-1/PfpI family protein [Acidimicrobiia bacterium]
MAHSTGIVLFDEAEELDWAGPLEVFGMAKMDGDSVFTVAENEGVITGWNGLRVLPDHTFADAPTIDILVVPGGWGTRREAANPAMIDFVRSVASGCTWVTSVCTGALVLAHAGLLAGKRVTTHWAALDELRALPDMEVIEAVRYVRDGNVVTAAGVSAGIDMALWVVGQVYGIDHARVTQYSMQYDPSPPYAAFT